MMNEKKELRKTMSGTRSMLSKEQVAADSKKIMQNLLQTLEYQRAKKIFCYVSFREEVDTFPLLHQAFLDGKEVLVPKVRGEEMDFCQISSLESLKPGAFGILEPADSHVEKALDGLLLLPGLAFDYQYNRMGYGGGYYDRYLKEHPKNQLVKAALAYEFQILEKIPAEAHDQKMDMIITPKKVFRR